MIHLLAAYMLTYGPGSLQTDEVFPAGLTVVALIHGGGFDSSAHDGRALQPEAKNLQAAGITAVIVNYDQGTMDSEVADVVAGARAVNATTIIGGSSGGTLGQPRPRRFAGVLVDPGRQGCQDAREEPHGGGCHSQHSAPCACRYGVRLRIGG
jgi:pimeloyl-ACP methyl ester carboxylesterase